jgi:hypothetical protein
MLKIKIMDEDKVMKQIIASNMNFHPIIKDSGLDLDDKLVLQHLLKNEFNNNFSELINDMMKYAVQEELYELAAIMKDFLNKEQ